MYMLHLLFSVLRFDAILGTVIGLSVGFQLCVVNPTDGLVFKLPPVTSACVVITAENKQKCN